MAVKEKSEKFLNSGSKSPDIENPDIIMDVSF
jgi:hypothetical protein